MSLQSRLADLITAIGADVKDLKSRTYWTTKVSTFDASNPSQTAVDSLELAFAAVPGTYIVEGLILYSTPTTTTAGWFALKWPAGSGSAAWIINESGSAATRFNQAASGVLSAGTSGPGATTPRLAQVSALIVVTTAGDIAVQFATEVAASTVTIKIGSYLRYQKIA